MTDDLEKENYRHSNLIMETVDLLDIWVKLTTMDDSAGKFLITVDAEVDQRKIRTNVFKDIIADYFNHILIIFIITIIIILIIIILVLCFCLIKKRKNRKKQTPVKINAIRLDGIDSSEESLKELVERVIRRNLLLRQTTGT